MDNYNAIYGRAYRAAITETRKVHADERYAKDAAHAVGAIVAQIAEGFLSESDLRKPDAAMEAGLATIRRVSV